MRETNHETPRPTFRVTSYCWSKAASFLPASPATERVLDATRVSPAASNTRRATPTAFIDAQRARSPSTDSAVVTDDITPPAARATSQCGMRNRERRAASAMVSPMAHPRSPAASTTAVMLKPSAEWRQRLAGAFKGKRDRRRTSVHFNCLMNGNRPLRALRRSSVRSSVTPRARVKSPSLPGIKDRAKPSKTPTATELQRWCTM
mmetsp:Transcript_17381/g.50753  ORF Transcript_17381/g.50753 Transcript_17381/m.50753 type:complete len:205 (-) Transcript_17381:452-1066(-)